MPIRLSPGERLIVVMLADLMEHLKVDSEIDPVQIKRFLWGNDDWALSLAYSHLFPKEGRDQADIDETFNILDMWRMIDNSVGDLSEEEKDGLDLDQFAFDGFDANEDPHYYIMATLVDDLGRYAERKPVLNSHSTVLPRYRRMYDRFRRVRDEVAGARMLNLDELKQIVDYRDR